MASHESRVTFRDTVVQTHTVSGAKGGREGGRNEGRQGRRDKKTMDKGNSRMMPMIDVL